MIHKKPLCYRGVRLFPVKCLRYSAKQGHLICAARINGNRFRDFEEICLYQRWRMLPSFCVEELARLHYAATHAREKDSITTTRYLHLLRPLRRKRACFCSFLRFLVAHVVSYTPGRPLHFPFRGSDSARHGEKGRTDFHLLFAS